MSEEPGSNLELQDEAFWPLYPEQVAEMEGFTGKELRSRAREITRLRVKAKICVWCGVKPAGYNLAPRESRRYCQDCVKEIRGRAGLCEECGGLRHPLDEPHQEFVR